MGRGSASFRPGIDVMESRRLLSAVAESIVTGLYRQVLLRDPGAGELARFSRVVDAGGSDRLVASRLYNSDEFRRNAVESYYDEILERDPTAAEIDRWSRVLARGGAEGRVAARIAGSVESTARFGGDAEAYVRSIFVGLVGRQADAAELAAYSGRIVAGTPAERVAMEVVDTDAFRIGKVEEAYQVVLGRLPSPAEARAWTSRWAGLGGGRGVSIRLLGGGENAQRLRGGAVPRPDGESIEGLRRILLAPYVEGADGFVQTYNRLLGTRPAEDADGNPVASVPVNTALWALTKAGTLDGRPADEVRTVSESAVAVATLRPLQSEIDIDKSLGFALSHSPASSDLKTYLAGGVIKPFGGAILTGGGGKYIIDGHHRWSSIYVINPDAMIESQDIGYEAEPQDYLKAAQLAVGAEMGYLQVQTVEGMNLFTIGRADFDAWVARTIEGGEDPQGVLDVFKAARGLDGIPAVADFLWGNVERMRRDNQPVSGSTSRDYMPQPPVGGFDAMIAWFVSGGLNTRLPAVARLG